MNLFVDVETTGLDYLNNCVLELACVAETNGKQHAFCERARPLSFYHFDKKSQEIHGISKAEAESFQHPRDLCINFLNFLESVYPYERYRPYADFWYHGIGLFDWRFVMGLFIKQGLVFDLRKYLNGKQVHSTLMLAKKQLQLPNYRLNTICDFLQIKLNHHEALSDARACAEIYQRLHA